MKKGDAVFSHARKGDPHCKDFNELEKIKRHLLALDTACVCDGNKAMRAADPTVKELRVIDPAIRPIRTDLNLSDGHTQ